MSMYPPSRWYGDDIENVAEIQAEWDADLEMGTGWVANVFRLCGILGVPKLSEATIPDYLRRLRIYEGAFGLFWRKDGVLVPFPREHVERLKGLRTNATPVGIRKFRESVKWSVERTP